MHAPGGGRELCNHNPLPMASTAIERGHDERVGLCHPGMAVDRMTGTLAAGKNAILTT